MRQPRPAPWGLALVLALAAVTLAPLSGAGAPPVVRAAATDLTLVTETTYTVRPADGLVHVDIDVVARNTTKETRTKRFYFDHAFLAVLPGVSELSVSGAKGARARVTRKAADSTLLRIDFGARVYSGRTRSFRVSFDLVDPGTPATRALRVGGSLVTLPVWAHASTGASGSSVRVRVPEGFEVTVETGSFPNRTTMPDGGTELSTGRLDDPLAFFAYVTAQRPAEYRDVPLAIGDGPGRIALVLRGWQDDADWATRIGGILRATLPLLREDIGVAWPHADPLVVQEAVSRSAGGYAGLFDPAQGRIEVAYWADHLVVIHEAAHAWFNGSLLADRWANEGFAALYAERAAAAAKEDGASPELTPELKPAAVPLDDWAVGAEPSRGEGTGGSPALTPTDAYGYAASLALARAVAERAGDDALRAVWADAAAGVGAYQPGVAPGTAAPAPAAPDAEEVAGPPDWRGLLDLLEARTGRDFTDLWRRWVVRPDQVPLLDARATARSAYSQTLALADAQGWALPRQVRDALRAWQFDTAGRLLADARTVLAQRGAVAQLAGQARVELPGDMQRLFESGDLVGASARAEAERNAVLAILGADGVRNADVDPLTSIGMLGEDPEADLAAARTALAAGDVDEVLARADDAYRAWNGAWQEGRRRALLAIAVLATILVLGSAIVARVRSAGRAGRTGLAPADTDPSAEEYLAAGTPPEPPRE